MMIKVTTLVGPTMEIETAACETIHRIKQRIGVRLRILPAEQHLLLAGKELMDSETVGQCNITDGSEIQLVLKVKTGYPKTVSVRPIY